VTVGQRGGCTPSPPQVPAGEQRLPGLQPCTEAGPAQPQLHLLEVPQPLQHGDGTPEGLCSRVTSKLSFFSLQVQPVVSCPGQMSCFLPAASLCPRGLGIHLPLPSFPRGWLTPTRQPLRTASQTSGRSRCPQLCSRCLLPTSVRRRHPKQGIFTGRNVAGLRRVLGVRCSFCISQQCSFFNLLFFFAAVQHSCLMFILQSITSRSAFLRSSYLSSFSLDLFSLLPAPCLLS